MTPKNLEHTAIAALANAAAVNLLFAQRELEVTPLTESDFVDRRLAAIFGVVQAMIRDGRVPDFFAVLHRLESSVPREMIHSVLVDDSATHNPRENFRVLVDLSLKRKAKQSLVRILELFRDSSLTLEEIKTEAQCAIDEIATGHIEATGADRFDGPMIDHVNAVAKGETRATLTTGIPALDAFTGGLPPTLTVIGSLPGVGKSALLASILRNLSARGDKVGFFSLEDEGQWLRYRLTSELAEVPVFKLQNSALSPQQLKRFNEATGTEKFKALKNVIIEDKPSLTTNQIVVSARRMLQQGVKALLVDHLGEIRIERSDRHDLDIADALTELRTLSKIYKVPVVVACHVRRREGLTEFDAPRLTDFAFSAAVERKARLALGLSKDRTTKELIVSILKQTSGVSGFAIPLEMNLQSATVKNTEVSIAQHEELRRIYGE
jgi:replicative DNA helicase